MPPMSCNHSCAQLLSPEKINREVLRALKRWDKFVFKTEVPVVVQQRHGQVATADNGLGDDQRPRNKVVVRLYCVCVAHEAVVPVGHIAVRTARHG